MKKFKNIETKLNASEDCLAENLLKLLHFHQINESDLAKKLQLPYNTIHRLLTGATTDPRVSTLQQIADFFGVTLDYLLNKNHSNHPLKQPRSHDIPVLNWVDLLDPNFKQQMENNPQGKRIQIAQIENIKNLKTLFAIESTKSMQPRFPSGTTFIVNTDERPMDGDLVLVRFKDNSISLRELIMDSPDWQLNAIIPGSCSLLFNLNEHEIIGIIVLTVIQTRNGSVAKTYSLG